MLKQLYIRNYVLLEEITIDFSDSLTIISGETGAGKSILLDALGLVLGQRSDTSVVRDKMNKCVVEAVFEVGRYEIQSLFLENDLDYHPETRIRREITAEGKSRAFVNDSPVNLTLLRTLAERLIDIHSQHESLLLHQSSFRFKVLDSFSGINDTLLRYRQLYSAYQEESRILEKLKADEIQLKKEKDFITFQYDEIKKLNLKAGDLANWQRESESLENADLIKSKLFLAYEILESSEGGILNDLNKVKQQLKSIEKFSTEYQELNARMNSLLLDCKELARDISSRAERVSADPERMNTINEKLDNLNRLLKKHRLDSDTDLIQLEESLEKKLEEITTLDETIQKSEKKSEQLLKEVIQSASAMTIERQRNIPRLESQLAQLLLNLKMPSATFSVVMSSTETPDSFGMNDLKFYFSANAGNESKELHKVASGGELSRLMLCIKNLIAHKTSLPTIVFDEIDTGVSGEVGARMGWMLEEMSKMIQVISITHLPQIAARGKHHLFVWKNEEEKKTNTEIEVLTEERRVVEIAKMLSSGKITEAAQQNARELLKS